MPASHRRKLGNERKELATPHLLAQHRHLPLVDTVKLKKAL
jgi:hypothetical protein